MCASIFIRQWMKGQPVLCAVTSDCCASRYTGTSTHVRCHTASAASLWKGSAIFPFHFSQWWNMRGEPTSSVQHKAWCPYYKKWQIYNSLLHMSHQAVNDVCGEYRFLHYAWQSWHCWWDGCVLNMFSFTRHSLWSGSATALCLQCFTIKCLMLCTSWFFLHSYDGFTFDKGWCNQSPRCLYLLLHYSWDVSISCWYWSMKDCVRTRSHWFNVAKVKGK